MEKISIIVTAYNIENYLPDCLDSLLAQTWSELEIILVDDGSSDATPAICDAYASKHPQIRVIHQPNQGPAIARNTGLDRAAGDLITFVDGDDIVSPDYCEHLYELIKESGCAISLCRMEPVDVDHRPIPMSSIIDPPFQKATLSGKEAFNAIIYPFSFEPAPWAKLYRREIFDDHHFVPGILFEDLELLARLFPACEKIACSAAIKYHYVQTPNSVMRSDDYLSYVTPLLKLTTAIKERYQDDPVLHDAVIVREVFSYLFNYDLAVRLEAHQSFEKDLKVVLKNDFSLAMSNRFLNHTFKLKLFVARLSLPLYRLLIRWRGKRAGRKR